MTRPLGLSVHAAADVVGFAIVTSIDVLVGAGLFVTLLVGLITAGFITAGFITSGFITAGFATSGFITELS